MCVRERIKYGVIAVLLMMSTSVVRAQSTDPVYLCELGVFGGCGYYVGDATPHIFMNVREVYGLQFRYKFTKRWAVQAKAELQRITGNEYRFPTGQPPIMLDSRWENNMINIDVMGEFNFFRFGSENPHDKRIKPYTPYIFLGIGVGIYGAEGYTNAQFNKAMAYFPFGIGFKWKFHPRWGLNVAWQHNVYFADNLENRPNLDNRYDLNGANIMNCDLTGQLTLGIVFEFGLAKKPCRICNSD
jgi:hypothetical protein